MVQQRIRRPAASDDGRKINTMEECVVLGSRAPEKQKQIAREIDSSSSFVLLVPGMFFTVTVLL